MSDSHIEYSRTGWFQKLLGSLVGVGVGVLIFFGALAVIWYGEGRTNMAAVARQSVVISPERVEASSEGRLVAATGTLQGDPLGDAPYLVPGAYLRLERVVEMFAWVERKNTERRENSDGSTTTRTTYSYRKEWTRAPQSGAGFHNPHHNPALSIPEVHASATNGQIGRYSVDLGLVELPAPERLALTPAMMLADDRWDLVDSYLFIGQGTLGSPSLGDVRISYQVVPAGTMVTLFGEQRGERIVSYNHSSGDVLFRALKGSRDEALDQLNFEDQLMDWGLRLGALFMLWISLVLLLGPVNALLGIIPGLAQVSGCLVTLLMIVPAIAIWGTALLVAIVAHNPWLLAGAVLVVIAGTVLLARRLTSRPHAPGYAG